MTVLSALVLSQPPHMLHAPSASKGIVHINDQNAARIGKVTHITASSPNCPGTRPPAGPIRALPGRCRDGLALQLGAARPGWSRPDRPPPFFIRRHTQKSSDSLGASRKSGRRYTQKPASGRALCRAADQNACCGLEASLTAVLEGPLLHPNHSAESGVMTDFVRLLLYPKGYCSPRHPSCLCEAALSMEIGKH